MKLSIYTFVKNGLYADFHVVDMLGHHLPLADEIVVNEGFSTDGTYEAIANLDPKIKVFRSEWGKPDTCDWFLGFKNEARRRCTGDWCILLDCDEFIPEWEFDRIRARMSSTDDIMMPLQIINFYGNYKVCHRQPRKVSWPAFKTAMHRNLPEIEVWGDGSNVRVHGGNVEGRKDNAEFVCHHYGFVRNPARLREKWRTLPYSVDGTVKKRFKIPSFLFDWLPHKWLDQQFLPDLAIYDGPYVKAVRDNPGEFVRDRFEVYEYLRKRSRSDIA